MRSLICSSVLGLWIACACAVTRAAETGDKDAAEWAKAEQAFVTFVTPVVKEARERLKDPRIQWARVNNDLLRKYLPDVRVYIRDGAFSGEDMLWIVTRDGTITALGDGTWRGVGGDKWRAVEKISAYIKGRRIKVESAERAVEVAKLIEFIAGAPSNVGMLRLNTKDYTVFDDGFLKWMYGSKDDWKYSAAKQGTGWQVKVEYVGPPAGVLQPPTYDLVLDGEKQFVDLRRR